MSPRGGSAADVLANVALNELETVQQAGRTVIGDAYVDRVDLRHDETPAQLRAQRRSPTATSSNAVLGSWSNESMITRLPRRIH